MLTSLGKRRTQIIAVGTLAPAPLTGPGAFWPQFVAAGSGDGGHVALLQADPEKWEDFDEVLRVNPVCAVNPYLRETLEREHRAALKSERAARTFRNYRLNLPGDPVESQPLNHNCGVGAGLLLARFLSARESPSSALTLAERAVMERSGGGVAEREESRRGQLRRGCRPWPTRSTRIRSRNPTYLELARSGGLSVDDARRRTQH